MKKFYQSPRTKVINVKAHQMLCASTETLTGEDFDWGEDGCSTETLTEEEFNW